MSKQNKILRNVGIALILYIVALMYIVQGETVTMEDRSIHVVLAIIVAALAAMITILSFEKD